MRQSLNELQPEVPLEVVRASEIVTKEVKWLWYPYIPYGKVTILQSDLGDGKAGISISTAKKAKRILGVQSNKPHFVWFWQLPDCEV